MNPSGEIPVEPSSNQRMQTHTPVSPCLADRNPGAPSCAAPVSHPPPNDGRVGLGDPFAFPPEPAPVLMPSPRKPLTPVARPPDPPPTLRPNDPVKPVEPVAIPPDPPAELLPKPPRWAALAGEP